jgi:hypothetical protein
MDKQRVMDWLQGGYGVEDIAVIMQLPVDDIRALVDEYRADGSLRMRLIIEPDNGTFLHCRRGHRQDPKTLGRKRDGARFCKICQREASRRWAQANRRAADSRCSIFHQ